MIEDIKKAEEIFDKIITYRNSHVVSQTFTIYCFNDLVTTALFESGAGVLGTRRAPDTSFKESVTSWCKLCSGMSPNV